MMPHDVTDPVLATDAFSDSITIAEQLNRTAGQFLLTDVETAHTLLDIAETRKDHSRRKLEFDRASEALATVNRFLGKLNLDPDLRARIEAARDDLRDRLMRMWPRFRAN